MQERPNRPVGDKRAFSRGLLGIAALGALLTALMAVAGDEGFAIVTGAATLGVAVSGAALLRLLGPSSLPIRLRDHGKHGRLAMGLFLTAAVGFGLVIAGVPIVVAAPIIALVPWLLHFRP